ncbi:ABC transporter substrate-binding protein [Pelagibacterium limicola]|uniref:ABC transporter substrate-binding protein n=1 Tax=Pelagibacterium limicola TaxID=2791022 RepID=UPI0018AF9B8B|nr:ABC transporter substrate-binding protein [Pelagibacterium limicola]
MKKFALAALVAALSMSTALPVSAQVANDDRTLALAALLDNNSFDRAQLMIANQIQFWQPVFDTLLVMEPDGSLKPNLVTEWAYNDTNSVLDLKLREGVTFTDGVALDAEAVKANLEYLKVGGGQNSYMAASIAQIEVISPTELRLHLGEPDPGLLEHLSVVGGAMASPATFGAESAATHPIGSGPYIYDTDASVAGRQYVYNRNPDYWNPEAYPFERVTITPINDAVARLNALKAGQVDAGLAEASMVADATSQGLVLNANDVNWIGLTLADRAGQVAPELADVRVRQAINMAFDKTSILQFFDLGFGRLDDQIFPTYSAAYDPELEARYPYDPEAARALLAEAGYGDGFTLTMPELASMANLNPIVEQQLADIGITVDWVAIAPNMTVPELRSGRYPAFLFQFGYQGDWAELRKFAFANSPWNTSAYQDAELDALVQQVQYASGDAQAALYQDINRYFVENAFFAPWYRRETIYLTNASVEVGMQAGNAVPFLRNYAPAN